MLVAGRRTLVRCVALTGDDAWNELQVETRVMHNEGIPKGSRIQREHALQVCFRGGGGQVLMPRAYGHQGWRCDELAATIESDAGLAV